MRRNHVDDRIHRADFVEMDFLGCRPVHFRLCLCNTPKRFKARLFDLGREISLFYDLDDMTKVPMRLLQLRVNVDVEFHRHRPVLVDFLGAHLETRDAQGRERIADRVEVRPRVDQRAHDHIARRAAEAVEV